MGFVKIAMSDATAVAAPAEIPATNNRATWFGLCLSLFSMMIIHRGFREMTPETGTALMLIRKACMFASAGVPVWLIRRKEGLPLRSIGIRTSPVWKSLAWPALFS
jgi:L-lactate permease